MLVYWSVFQKIPQSIGCQPQPDSVGSGVGGWKSFGAADSRDLVGGLGGKL